MIRKKDKKRGTRCQCPKCGRRATYNGYSNVMQAHIYNHATRRFLGNVPGVGNLSIVNDYICAVEV